MDSGCYSGVRGGVVCEEQDMDVGQSPEAVQRTDIGGELAETSSTYFLLNVCCGTRVLATQPFVAAAVDQLTVHKLTLYHNKYSSLIQ